MIRTALAAASLLLAAPAIAQSQQEVLDARYHRALAAGYKALMLCSAIAIAERNGTTRTPESVAQWELTGIQSPQAELIGDLAHEIVRRPSGQVAEVRVRWAEDMPPRAAVYYGPETGCSILPPGAPEGMSNPGEPMETPADAHAKAPAGSSAPAEVSASGLTGTRLAGPVTTRGTQDKADILTPFVRAFLGEYGKGARTTALLVRSLGDGGEVHFEAQQYAPGFDARTPQRTWSVAKSIAATLVGAAVQAGDARVEDPVGLAYWQRGGAADLRNAITIDHLLRMASGRYSDTPGNRTDPLYFGGSTVDETATGWPVLHPPGTVFRYANNDTLMAVKAIGQWLQYYPPHEFFAQLGMDNTVAETDWRGDYVLSSQVWSTAGDLANLGQLYLKDGVWNGERILPEGWVRYVSTPSGPQPEGPFGYGAGFWLMNRSEGIPPDTFAAFGNRGQYVVIVPSRQVVIVRRGEDPVGSRFDIAAFTRDVLAALEGA